jgi:hypothetical protein
VVAAIRLSLWSLTVVTPSNDDPKVRDPIQWPPYASKADVLRDLEQAAAHKTGQAIFNVLQRVSASDPFVWYDRGSRID